MALRDMIDKAKSATDGLGDVAQAQLKGWLADFKKAATVLETFGFTIGKVGFGMGVLPEIHTSLVGSIDDIHEDRLQKLMEEHKGEELLVSLLKTLIWVRWGWAQLDVKKLHAVTLHVTLGLPPRVSAEVN